MVLNNNDYVEALYIEEYENLIRIAYRLTNDPELLQDLVHETLLLAIFHQQKLKTHPKPGAWLLITLRNLVFNEQRLKAHADTSLDEAVPVPQSALDPLDDLLPAQLRTEERQILIWRFEEQLSYAMISGDTIA